MTVGQAFLPVRLQGQTGMSVLPQTLLDNKQLGTDN